VSAQTKDHQIVIRIEDNGPGLGLDPELLFKAFYTTKSTGTGLAYTGKESARVTRKLRRKIGRKEERFEIVLPLAARREHENLSG
jgi:signal transduction histidine kinase